MNTQFSTTVGTRGNLVDLRERVPVVSGNWGSHFRVKNNPSFWLNVSLRRKKYFILLLSVSTLFKYQY